MTLVFAGHCPQLIHQPDEFRLGTGFPIHSKTLFKSVQVRGGIESSSQTTGREHRRHHRGDRSLSLGAGNVNEQLLRSGIGSVEKMLQAES